MTSQALEPVPAVAWRDGRRSRCLSAEGMPAKPSLRRSLRLTLDPLKIAAGLANHRGSSSLDDAPTRALRDR